MSITLEELASLQGAICARGFVGYCPDCTKDPVKNPCCSGYVELHILDDSVMAHSIFVNFIDTGKREITIRHPESIEGAKSDVRQALKSYDSVESLYVG